MKSVLLIYPYFNSGSSRSIFRFPPLGLAYLASAVRKAGHEVSILDCTFMDRNEALRKASQAAPDVVGIYCMVTMKRDCLRFARLLRQKCDLLVAGGPLPSCDPATFLEDFDAVVRGEGEWTFEELLAVEAGRSWKCIPGLAYRNNGHGQQEIVFTQGRELRPVLDDVAFPSRDLLPNANYIQYYRKKVGRAVTSVMTTRGCPFSCEFCSNAVFGNSYRERSPENVVDEVEGALSLGYDHIHFGDDVFTLHKERVIKVCQEIKQRKLRLTWECLARVDSIDRDVVRHMKEAGCRRIFFGIESADAAVLKLMNKKIDVQKAAGAVEMANEAGIKTGAFFILCYPGDTNDSVLRTIKFATALPLDYLSFTLPYPLPGTALYNRMRGRITREWEAHKSGILTDHTLTFMTDFSQAKMKSAILKGQAQFKLRKLLGRRGRWVVETLESITDVAFRLLR